MERSAGRACARARRDGCRDELVREEEVRDLRQGGEHPLEPNVWDAWDVARQDAMGDAAHRHRRERRGADAEKLADRARGDRAPGAFLLQWVRWSVRLEEERAAAAALCRPDVVRFAARSCAALAAAEPLAESDAAAQLTARRKL